MIPITKQIAVLGSRVASRYVSRFVKEASYESAKHQRSVKDKFTNYNNTIWQTTLYWSFYDSEELQIRIIVCMNHELSQRLHHEAREATECTGYAASGVCFNENSCCNVNIDLKISGLI